MTTEMPGLKPLEITDTLMIRDYLNRYPRENCDYTITNLIVWGMIYNNMYLLWKDSLVFFNPRHKYIFFPVGEGFSPGDLRDLVLEFKRYYHDAEMILFPEDYLQQHPEIQELFEIHEDRAWADYLYQTQKMVSLSGKKLAKKKNLISQFVRAYPHYKVLKIKDEHLEVLLQFTNKWRKERSAEGIYLMTELKAIENTLAHWHELPVEGLIICLDYKIAAYSIFSAQTTNMATVHFEKFDPDKKGSAQIINWETARYLSERFDWINREQDIGLEGLRQAKLSYAPDRFAPFYASQLRDNS